MMTFRAPARAFEYEKPPVVNGPPGPRLTRGVPIMVAAMTSTRRVTTVRKDGAVRPSLPGASPLHSQAPSPRSKLPQASCLAVDCQGEDARSRAIDPVKEEPRTSFTKGD